jgi:hypothetical protein
MKIKIINKILPFCPKTDFKSARLPGETFVIMARRVKILLSEKIPYAKRQRPVLTPAKL